jgi:hypothetical protein
MGITKYDAKQNPVQWLRCYALSIENAGGNNDTKCLYFPFCLNQVPLTWLESLEKYSIDKWDQLKEQFTSNFTGTMGRSGTRMDLAMVKQEQGETLRKYMRCFFDKRATVVDVTDKEVIDIFQDGLYHRRTLEDFGRRRPSSITKLKDMITHGPMKKKRRMLSMTLFAARASKTRVAATTITGIKAVATTTTRALIASASQTTQLRLSSAMRKTTRRSPPAASRTC